MDNAVDKYSDTSTGAMSTLTWEELKEQEEQELEDVGALRFLLQETRFQMMRPLIAELNATVPPADYHTHLQEEISVSESTVAYHQEKLIQKDILDLSERPYDDTDTDQPGPVYHLGERGEYLVDRFNWTNFRQARQTTDYPDFPANPIYSLCSGKTPRLFKLQRSIQRS